MDAYCHHATWENGCSPRPHILHTNVFSNELITRSSICYTWSQINRGGGDPLGLTLLQLSLCDSNMNSFSAMCSVPDASPWCCKRKYGNVICRCFINSQHDTHILTWWQSSCLCAESISSYLFKFFSLTVFNFALLKYNFRHRSPEKGKWKKWDFK